VLLGGQPGPPRGLFAEAEKTAKGVAEGEECLVFLLADLDRLFSRHVFPPEAPWKRPNEGRPAAPSQLFPQRALVASLSSSARHPELTGSGGCVAFVSCAALRS